MFAPKQNVRIKRLVGPAFEPDWKERGTIMKPRAENLPLPGPDWYIVRFETGGSMCIHETSLMADNA